jgi:hypothetical protein
VKSANPAWRSNPRVTARPLVSSVPVSCTMPASRSDRYMLMARRWCFRLRISGSWFRTKRSYRYRLPSPCRDNTARIIPCVTSKLDSSVSGVPVSILRNESSRHGVWPFSGGLDLVNLRAFLPLFAAPAAALASLRWLSITCGWSWHHT